MLQSPSLPLSLSYAMWMNHSRREYVLFAGNDVPLQWLFYAALGRWDFVKDFIVSHVRHSFDDFDVVPIRAYLDVHALWTLLLHGDKKHVQEAFSPVSHATYFCINNTQTRQRLSDAQLAFVDALKKRTADASAGPVLFQEVLAMYFFFVNTQNASLLPALSLSMSGSPAPPAAPMVVTTMIKTG